MLVIFCLALFFNVSDVSAAENNQSTVLNSSSQIITTNTPISNPGSTGTVNNQSKATPVSPKVTFTTTQLNTASAKVKDFFDTNDRLPNYVTISNKKVTMPQFLLLLTEDLAQINNGTSNSLILKNVKTPVNPAGEFKSCDLIKSEYIDLSKQIKTTIDATGQAPDYINSSLGKIPYESVIYTYSQIISYYNTNQKLPDTVLITPQVTSTQSTTIPEGTKTTGIARPVYIVSDNINGLKQDTARINTIISELSKLGISAYNYGIGPQTHNTVLSNKNVPKNALIVEIAGGADAGCLYEKGTKWYKNQLGTRIDFIVFTSGATKITGLDFLKRSHDDNYSASSFKGLANPDQFLINNGIDYFEGLTNNNITQLVQAIYNAANS